MKMTRTNWIGCAHKPKPGCYLCYCLGYIMDNYQVCKFINNTWLDDCDKLCEPLYYRPLPKHPVIRIRKNKNG